MTKSVNNSVNTFPILSSSLKYVQGTDNQIFKVILLHILGQSEV